MLDGGWAAPHPDHRPRPAAQCLPAQLQTSQRFVACRDSLLFEDKNLNFLGKPSFKQELKALLDPEFSIITTFLELFEFIFFYFTACPFWDWLSLIL